MNPILGESGESSPLGEESSVFTNVEEDFDEDILQPDNNFEDSDTFDEIDDSDDEGGYF